MSSNDSQPAPVSGSSSSEDPSRSAEKERFEDSYRAISGAAVVAMILAVLGLFGFWFKMALAFSLLGLVFGIVARRNLTRYPEELTGNGITRIALLLCCLGLFGGAGLHTYEYMTEVPDGFGRVAFFQLQPPTTQSREPIPEFAFELVKDKGNAPIFIKGYVHPGVSTFGEVNSFVLVPDMKTCCFGGQPKLTDMIEVTLEDPLRVKYSVKKRKLWGDFSLTDMQHVTVGTLKDGKQMQGGYYKLHAVGVK
tara:strand:+ start:3594 stop:4346 length:753 start_codon:yes stop_codon:yes gene_type:complete